MENSGTAIRKTSGLSTPRRKPYRQNQRGVALLVVLTALTLLGLSLFIGQFSATQFQVSLAQNTLIALAEAKQALIGDAISKEQITNTGFLSLPDLGTAYGAIKEGQEAGTFADDAKDLTVIGKFPWKTLDTKPLRGKNGECFWFTVSGRFKNDTPLLKTDVLNWDTLGQIDVIDVNGNVIASNLAALLIAPGRIIDGQNRALADPTYTQCGGNYDARNYLDAYDVAGAIAGEVNYFTGSTNNRLAPNTNNKRFVMAATDHYNDQFLFITSDDIFTPLIRRSDFAIAIGNLLDDADFRLQVETGHTETESVSSGVGKEKGTSYLKCEKIYNADNQRFCTNWKEMLFLTQLPAPAPIRINGAFSANCNRVLLFSGKKVVGQSRNNAMEKADKNNYLEAQNLLAFNVPNANSTDFSGASAFDWRTPGTDLIRCLP